MAMNWLEVTAPETVRVLEAVFTLEEKPEINVPSIMIKLQVSDPTRVNSEGKVMVILEPEGTASVR